MTVKRLYLEVNASQKAKGMALMQSVQEEQHQSEAHGDHWVDAQIDTYKNTNIPDDLLPVAYSSKTLIDTESGYANIE